MKQKTLILLGLLIFLFSCSTTLKSKTQILNFKVEISKLETAEILLCKISGKTADSALWIKSYKIEYEGSNLFVVIEKSLKQSGISDPYFIQFIIPESTERVYLGRKEVIWQR